MDDETTPASRRLTRRSLMGLGGLAALGAAGVALDPEASAGPAGVASGALSCVLAPEQTEGPYYIPGEKVRRDVREGHPGARLTLRLQVVSATACRALKGATVEIWHCDAAGNYSGFNTTGAGQRTYLRGAQRTDAAGLAEFITIYPGWYHGRTVHIHVKVHVGGNVVHTGQLYFQDTLTDAVYRHAPYAARASGRDTRNADDAIFRNGGRLSLLTVKKQDAGYAGAITMGVHAS
jgi:protocatechuate 3,4-dioxygenase beta subunit